MAIYSEGYYDGDWNEIIKEFHELQLKIWEEDLMTANIFKKNERFNKCVFNNAPYEAEKVIYELQDLFNN